MSTHTEISPAMIGKLRSTTGAGIMLCKEALQEAEGDFDKAIEILRKKGLQSASKKSDRATSEGLIESYIHFGGKIGVLLELKCETDFVGSNTEFKELARDICIHIAASDPQFVTREDVPESVLEKEREIVKAQIENKPPHAVEKIVEGKLEKFYAENCLLDQPFVKDAERSVKEIINEKIAKLGENVTIGRFVRYKLGE